MAFVKGRLVEVTKSGISKLSSLNVFSILLFCCFVALLSLFLFFGTSQEKEHSSHSNPNDVVTHKTQILSSKDIELYKRAFSASDMSMPEGYDKSIASKVDNNILLGSLIAETYLASSKNEEEQSSYNSDGLSAWLKKYSNLPQYEQIKDLYEEKSSESASGKLKNTDSPALNASGNFSKGLKLWSENKIDKAADSFAKSFRSEAKGASEKTAAAYWAYRAYYSLGKYEDAYRYLHHATRDETTFYGIIANQVAEQVSRRSTKEMENEFGSFSAIKRAKAMVEIERFDLASKELAKLHAFLPDNMKVMVEEFAENVGIKGFYKNVVAELEKQQDKKTIETVRANYPVPDWKPSGGFSVEPSLIYALIKKESGFSPNAKSSMGAVGLMQLMPKTADYIAEKSDNIASSKGLNHPEQNIGMGQAYIKYLMRKNDIGGNMIYLAASYNAGPGRFVKWLKEYGNDDPLLFVESIPVAETRNFVKDVMANYWIYSDILGNDTNSIEQLAGGNWPAYEGKGASNSASAVNSSFQSKLKNILENTANP